MPASEAKLSIDSARLMRRLSKLGAVGGLAGGGCARLALTDEDRDGRDLVVSWMYELGLEITIDTVGNVVGKRAGRDGGPPVMTGSHIDTGSARAAFSTAILVCLPDSKSSIRSPRQGSPLAVRWRLGCSLMRRVRVSRRTCSAVSCTWAG